MTTFKILLMLFGVCIMLAALAQRWRLPAAVLLVLAGSTLAFVPYLPEIVLDPELALALFLPPLLQASAYRTDWPGFKANLRPILLLAVGAVLFTTVCVAIVVTLLVPALPWWAAVALGAIVSPPDAVAAKAVLRNLRLPPQLATVLEGESMINDASSLVLYRFAVAAVLAGAPSLAQGVADFGLAAVGGIVIGYATGRIAMWAFARIDDTVLDIAVSFLAGYAAYLLAETLHVSGVLGAVTCGLMLGRKQHQAFTAQTRLAAAAVWEFVEFVLESFAFMLISLQLRSIIDRLADGATGGLVVMALVIVATLIASRFVWMFAAAWLPRLLSRRIRRADAEPAWQHLVVLSWAGMRGVVSLAAALALPAAFPGRDLIIFLVFSAILATLVVQGTTIAWVTQRLGVAASPSSGDADDSAGLRAEVTIAARDAVAETAVSLSGEARDAAADVANDLTLRADRAGEAADAGSSEATTARLTARLNGINAAREHLFAKADAVETEAGRALGEELDLEEQQIRRALDAATLSDTIPPASSAGQAAE
jgi:monovalent cation/hydrogen antiporter